MNRILLLSLLFFSSCALKVDESEAKQKAESLLNDLKTENYADIDQYYSALSNESESHEQKIERFKQLRETTGPIQSFTLQAEKQQYDSDRGLNQLELKYKVVCEKTTVIQTFLFINDEGTSRIIFQNIETLK